MVIGHEIGHHRAGHLDLALLLAPGRLLPFLGSAYSRACEHTCDRWGSALCGEPAGALRGLAILAAGGKFGPRVNLSAFVAQRASLDTGWMTIGRWLSNYPPLSARVAALEPGLDSGPASTRGAWRAAGILGAFVAVPTVLAVVAVSVWLSTIRPFLESAGAGSGPAESPLPETEEEIAAAIDRVEADFLALEDAVAARVANGGALPTDADGLREAWEAARPGESYPTDPFDGLPYAFGEVDGAIHLQSSGPDGEIGSEDDIERTLAPAEAGPS
jgi:hypothetical protein